MENLMGYLIKYERLQHNYSQDGLCKGICVVSYLSKIENGLVNPSDDIIVALFQRLDINYCSDEEMLMKYEKLFLQYFDYVLFESDIFTYYHDNPYTEEIFNEQERLLYSRLSISYRLFLAYERMLNKNDIREDINSLGSFVSHLDNENLFIFNVLKASYYRNNGKIDEAIILLKKTDSLIPISTVSSLLSDYYTVMGEYQKALGYAIESYNRACDEGNLSVIIHAAINEFMCYGALNELDLMFSSYRRAERLLRNDQRKLHTIGYNLGACLLLDGRYHEAIEYLLAAVEARKKSNWNAGDFLSFQKLIIAYFKDNQKTEAVKYLDYVKSVNFDGVKEAAMITKSIEVLDYWREDHYLSNDDYFNALSELYDEPDSFYGLKRFYGTMLVEALINRRKYKEALKIVNKYDIKWKL